MKMLKNPRSSLKKDTLTNIFNMKKELIKSGKHFADEVKAHKQDENYWKRFASIQLMPISRRSMGKSIAFTFISPMIKKPKTHLEVSVTPVKKPDAKKEKKRERKVLAAVAPWNPWAKKIPKKS